MLVIKERRAAIRTLQGWAISVLVEAGAISECEEHGWMKDRGDPHARERALSSSPARILRPASLQRKRSPS
jgi:hypothetical protein